MADSDNSMTLPFVTRRRVLVGGMITSIALVLEKSALAGNVAATSALPDPALTLWREWETAYKLSERLCRSQQRLETRLVESIGFPGVTVRLPEGEDVMVHSIGALNEVLGKGPDMAALREKAASDLAAQQARWDAAAEEAGYTAALRAEREAGERARTCWKRFLLRLPPPSLVWQASSMPCCAWARPGRNAPSSRGRKSARRLAIWCASPRR
ncbi:hypothetical protein NKJ90_18210 [Mesorhizobium sp. M0051]|uniref:hypothetical protein n=1 Tax=Mesorhizobium sp. M0051 TaxID=2956862 RepID=UPI00333C3293